MTRWIGILRLLDGAIFRAEVVGVTVALLLMVTLKFVDVVMRNIGKGGVPEFAVIAQHLVLWTGMLGASLATAERKHISIELFGGLLTAQGRRVVDGIVDVATMFTSALLAYVAWQWLVTWERPEQKVIFELPGWLGGTPFRAWWSLAIIPLGFAMISFRFGKLALERVFVEEAAAAHEEVRAAAAEADRRYSSAERDAAPAAAVSGGGEGPAEGEGRGAASPAPEAPSDAPATPRDAAGEARP